MKVTQSFFTLGASLLLVLLFVFAVNLGTSSPASADHSQDPSPLANQDEDFDPIQEEEQEAEVWDEEQEGEESENELGDEFEEDGDEFEEEGDEFEEEGDWDEDMEEEVFEFEMERMQVDVGLGRLEVINRLSEIAGDETQTAAYAIMHLQEFIDQEEAVDMLQEVVASEGTTLAIKNLAKMKLVEFYAWNDEMALSKEMLKSMIMQNE